MEETIVENAGDGALGVTADILGFLDTTLGESVLNLGDELLGVGFRERQIEDPLDSEGKTKDQAEDDRGHEGGTSLDEIGLDLLVERNILTSTLEEVLSGELGGLLGGGGLILSGRDAGGEGESTCYSQEHEKLFHNRFRVF